MSRTLELPDPVYAALEEAASASGLTPAAWIAAHLPASAKPAQQNCGPNGATTLADRFAGRVGTFDSGGRERLSENSEELFGEYLEAKRRAGIL